MTTSTLAESKQQPCFLQSGVVFVSRVNCACVPGGDGAGAAGVSVQRAAAGAEHQQPTAPPRANYRGERGKGERDGVLVQCIRGKRGYFNCVHNFQTLRLASFLLYSKYVVGVVLFIMLFQFRF